MAPCSHDWVIGDPNPNGIRHCHCSLCPEDRYINADYIVVDASGGIVGQAHGLRDDRRRTPSKATTENYRPPLAGNAAYVKGKELAKAREFVFQLAQGTGMREQGYITGLTKTLKEKFGVEVNGSTLRQWVQRARARRSSPTGEIERRITIQRAEELAKARAWVDQLIQEGEGGYYGYIPALIARIKEKFNLELKAVTVKQWVQRAKVRKNPGLAHFASPPEASGKPKTPQPATETKITRATSAGREQLHLHMRSPGPPYIELDLTVNLGEEGKGGY